MRVIKITLIMLALLVATTILIGYGWMRSSLPQINGEVSLSGLNGEVTIARDKHGVPHISASTDHDIHFALGYTHAQDRLWQMESNRRIGHGRLAEVVGEGGLGFDRFFRTLGFTERAEDAWEGLDEAAKSGLQAYADGVNAFLNTNTSPLPPEFLILGVTPEPWSPVDTLVWQKMMWLDLSGNFRREIARARLLTKFTPEQASTIFPSYPGTIEPELPNLSVMYGALELDAVASAVGPEKPEGYGSNNWVISGDHTKSGKPLLANDPHLGLTTPSIWYLARLHNSTTNANMVGVSFPGSPSIVLGRNDRIAWGFTNTAPDIQDTFIEKLVGENQYMAPAGPADFKVRDEIIKVRGGDQVTLKVRETRHGPVISDINPQAKELTGDGYALSLQWTALGKYDTGVISLMKIASATNFEEFKAAGRYYFGPEQNMIYADIDGNIGYYAPARVPIRHPDNEINGRLPSPGWLSKYDWQGFIDYNELPLRENPASGIIATANEKIVGDDYPHFITGDWSLPYRGNRIRALLSARSDHDLASFREIQSDYVSDMARDVTPWLTALVEEESDILSALNDWDGSMDANTPEPLIFHTWLNHYQAGLLADEFGDLYGGFRRSNPQLVKSSAYWAQENPESDSEYYALPPLEKTHALTWCDNTETPNIVETCRDIANSSFNSAIEELEGLHGKDWQSWRWGDVHTLTQTHRPMSQIPFVGQYFELKDDVNGGRFTINVAGAGTNPNSLHISTYGPSYRGIFDLSNLENSLYIQPTGQSGNPFSEHFGDLFPLWRNNKYFTIKTDKVIPDEIEGLLTLKPVDSGQ